MVVKHRTHRRSGNAVFEVAEIVDWRPSLIVQVGVGTHAHETEVFTEEWPDVPLVGFEPNPESFEKIKKKYPGKLIQKAVGHLISDSVPFYSKKDHDNGSSLLRVGEDKSKLTEHQVKMTMLDAPNESLGFGHNGKDILLWLDCEGTEFSVLLGGQRFLSQVQMVNVEMTGKSLDKGWCTPLDVDRLLRKHGFYLSWVHTIRTKLGQYDAVYVRGDIFNPNICCCPTEIERWKKEHK